MMTRRRRRRRPGPQVRTPGAELGGRGQGGQGFVGMFKPSGPGDNYSLFMCLYGPSRICNQQGRDREWSSSSS